MEAARPERLPRVLGPVQGFAIVVGGVIGGSIFLVPSVVAQRVPFLSGILLVWLLGAAVSLTGVLTYCELSAMLPEAGGGYVYIRAALGPEMAFLFGWTDAFLIRAGVAATVSFAFAIFFSQVLGRRSGWRRQFGRVRLRW
jgi:amino acid transporter